MAKREKDDIWQDFQSTVNMTVTELEAWRDSDNRAAYAERKNKGQDIDEPLDDAIRLLETNKADWECKDDGFNECKEANELDAFEARMSQVESGEPIAGTDPPLSKRDSSLINWAIDPNPGKSDFVGDRQR